MNESGSPGRYPPDEIWRFPAPPLSRGWLWLGLCISLVSLVIIAIAVAVAAPLESRDMPGIIDDDHVIEVARRECRLMTSTVEGLPLDGTPQERLAALDDQNVAVLLMVEHIRRLDLAERAADRPVNAWLADWERLVMARTDYLGTVHTGDSPDFTVPKARDGAPITDRMEAAGSSVCKVPRVLLEPDTAGATAV